MIEDYLFLNDVPAEIQPMVNRLRHYLSDYPELNDLLGDEESTDLELFRALIDTWDQINNEIEPSDLHFKDIKKISWSVLRQGAVLNVLMSKSILSARNMLSYNDTGGITVNDVDVYGRYINLFNVLLAQYRRGAMSIKRSLNINGAYGGVHSEYLYGSSEYND